MYKSMLQEFCQKNSWKLPVYNAVKDGPEHRPLFTGTVIVNGITYESSIQCGSSKEAQNVAAQVAINHFYPPATIPPAISRFQEHAAGTAVLTTNRNTEAAESERRVEQNIHSGSPLAKNPTSTKEGLLNTYKNRLQMYAQKRNLILPAYSCEIVGPPHVRLYKSKVTVDGKSFETQEFFSTLKDAEQGAAKVAFESMSLHLTQQDEVLYKTLLQEHAQGKGLRLPTYDTVRSGPTHMSIFVSTVEVGGKSYQGQEAKTKKMAEINAAKAAYICLTKCQETQYSNSSGGETSDASTFNLQPDVTETVEEDVAREISISNKEQAQEIQDNNGKRQRYSTTSEDAHAQEGGSSIGRSLPQDPIVIVIPPEQPSVRMIMVSPHTPNMNMPEGANILPTTDDKWVAVSMDVPEEVYNKEYDN